MASYLNKYFFTGAAFGGASVYFYDQKQQQRRFDVWNNVYRDKDDIGEAIKNKTYNVSSDINATANDTYDRAKGKVEDLTSEASKKTSHTKDSVVGGVYGVRDAVVHTAEYTKEQLTHDHDEEVAKKAVKDAQDAKNSWFNWGSKQAETTSDKVNKDVQNLKKDAKATYNDTAKQAEETKNSWFNWGSKKADEAQSKADGVRKDVNNQYEGFKKDAKANYNETAKQAEETKNSWLNWGSKKADEAKDNLDSQYQRAQRKSDQALDDSKSEIDLGVDKIKRGANDFGLWSKNKIDEVKDKRSQLTEEELARINSNALSGWGESASQFAKDEVEIAKNK